MNHNLKIRCVGQNAVILSRTQKPVFPKINRFLLTSVFIQWIEDNLEFAHKPIMKLCKYTVNKNITYNILIKINGGYTRLEIMFYVSILRQQAPGNKCYM